MDTNGTSSGEGWYRVLDLNPVWINFEDERAFDTYRNLGIRVAWAGEADGGEPPPSGSPPAPEPGDGPCVPNQETRCLRDGRFEVRGAYETVQGDQGTAKVVSGGTDDSLNMWFFQAANWELMIKVLDGCGSNNHFWVFAGGTTNTGVAIRVRDTKTDVSKVFRNPVGENYQTIADTSAFATCP